MNNRDFETLKAVLLPPIIIILLVVGFFFFARTGGFKDGVAGFMKSINSSTGDVLSVSNLEAFNKEISSCDVPVAVLYYSRNNCACTKNFGNVSKEFMVAAMDNKKVKFIKIDVDSANHDLAGYYKKEGSCIGYYSLPIYKVFYKGDKIGEFGRTYAADDMNIEIERITRSKGLR